MSKKVAIIGCGQLGSRHLQAIAKLEMQLELEIVEPSRESQKMASNRLSEVMPENENLKIKWLNDLEDITQDSDLTIVSTNAIGRAEILKKLSEKGHHRFLIEKMVCQSIDEYKSVLEIFNKRHIKAWVDCTRRYFPFYNRIIKLMENEDTFFFNTIGGNHGLGCNAIHFLDLFWRMAGLTKELKLNGDYLIPTLQLNRRDDNLVEFSGTIVASAPQGSFASLSFHPGNNASILINISSENYRIAVNESKDKALFAQKENNWQWEEQEFKLLFSSDLTTRIASSVFEYDECELPTLQESFLLHKELFRIFNHHIKLVTGKNASLCPIT